MGLDRFCWEDLSLSGLDRLFRPVPEGQKSTRGKARLRWPGPAHRELQAMGSGVSSRTTPAIPQSGIECDISPFQGFVHFVLCVVGASPQPVLCHPFGVSDHTTPMFLARYLPRRYPRMRWNDSRMPRQQGITLQAGRSTYRWWIIRPGVLDPRPEGAR